jgi:hypothetical protein
MALSISERAVSKLLMALGVWSPPAPAGERPDAAFRLSIARCTASFASASMAAAWTTGGIPLAGLFGTETDKKRKHGFSAPARLESTSPPRSTRGPWRRRISRLRAARRLFPAKHTPRNFPELTSIFRVFSGGLGRPRRPFEGAEQCVVGLRVGGRGTPPTPISRVKPGGKKARERSECAAKPRQRPPCPNDSA